MSWVLHTKRSEKPADPMLVCGIYKNGNVNTVLITMPRDTAKSFGLDLGTPFTVHLQEIRGKYTGKIRFARHTGDPKEAERFVRQTGQNLQLAFSMPSGVKGTSASNFVYKVVPDGDNQAKKIEIDLTKPVAITERSIAIRKSGKTRGYKKRAAYWEKVSRVLGSTEQDSGSRI